MAGELRPGEPNAMMYVKFADQFLAKVQYDNALFYVERALAMNPNCLVCILNPIIPLNTFSNLSFWRYFKIK